MSAPGFFTRGVTFSLPHPEIHLRLILIVHAVVARGLQLLREHPPLGFDFGSAQEDSVTFQLHWVIANRLHKNKEVPGFDKRSFTTVEREPKVCNFDGSQLDKMPDLVFRLNRDQLPVLASHHGLFVECKPVDKDHPAGQDYCDAGLQRFVDGGYAWTMQDALMLAYVRDGRSIARNLIPAIAPRRKKLGVLQEPVPLDESGASSVDGLHVSLHVRVFRWPDGRGRACNIRVFHSWHSCS